MPRRTTVWASPRSGGPCCGSGRSPSVPAVRCAGHRSVTWPPCWRHAKPLVLAPMASSLVLKAVHNGPAVGRKALLDHLFAWWFGRFVYNQIWEDPQVDRIALALEPGHRVVAIASGGCNLLAYL